MPSYAKSATLGYAETSDTITYELIVTNTGLLDVFNVAVNTWGDGEGISSPTNCDHGEASTTVHGSGVLGLAPYPDEGLRGGTSFTCEFSATVGQAEVNK